MRVSGYGQCFPFAANLGSVEGCRTFASELAARESRVDVQVNNAGNIWVEKLADYPALKPAFEPIVLARRPP